MGRRVLVAMAGLLLLVSAAVAPAQERPAEAAPPADTLPDLGLPAHVAEPILAFFNNPATIHFSGRTRIPAERVIIGDVAVLGGPFVLAGRIEGDVLVIDGDLELLETAAIRGDVTVVGGVVTGLEQAEIGGEVVTYSERLLYYRRGDHLTYERRRLGPAPEPRDGWLARSDFLIASGRSYNRVEGLPITFGPVIETAGSNPLLLRAMAIYRTESGATLDPERLGYYLRAEQYLGGHRRLRIGGTLHSVVEPIEDWHVINLENSLSTFLLHRDFRDHFEREGWSAFLALGPPRRTWELGLVGRHELHRSLPTGSPWTLFRNQETWRAQPLVAEGTVSSLSLEGRYDTRSSSTDPAHGWYVTGSVERTLHSNLRRPDAVLAMPLPIAEPTRVEAEDFPRWTRGVLDVRRYNRLSPEARLNLRLLLGGSLDGSPLPPQRQHALGGEGSLPGYRLFQFDCGARARQVFHAEALTLPVTSNRDTPPTFVPGYGCDQFALVQAEYRGKLSLRFGWGGSPWGDRDGQGWNLSWAATPDWVAFVDAARAWAVGSRTPSSGSPVPDAAHALAVEGRSEDFALDLGFGLLFHRVGVYVATPLTGEGGLNLFVRLNPRF